MKKLNKKGFAIPGIIILILIILVIYFGFIRTGNIFPNTECKYFWDVSSYNPATGEMVISYQLSNIQANGGGTVCPVSAGTQTHNTQKLNINSEKDCTDIFEGSATWTTLGNGQTGCFLMDENAKSWINDKTLVYSGGCTRTDSGALTSFQELGGFNGLTFAVTEPGCSRCFAFNCDMSVKITNAQTPISTPVTPGELPSIDIPATPQVECSSNVNCMSICGSKTPTCESGSCKCSGVPVVVNHPQTGNWLDRIGWYVQGIIDKIFGVFSK
jgi:hypothetical protein